ncbi:MAG: metallophosphoesterase family protein [Rhodobacteraceae bacterium]|nr:metallophosphoesterase family protein [Paracoccaceae bacterium]
MTVAVIADIHGNSAALDAVLADIARRKIGTVLNLGDSLSGPLDPAGTADRLIAEGIASIAGNHDRALIDRPAVEYGLWEQWTGPLLSAAYFDWLRGLAATMRVGEMFLCHGTPQSDDENWLHLAAGDRLRPATHAEAAGPARGLDSPVILSAHTHMPRVVRLRGGPLLVNPGSVGCPAYRDGRVAPPFIAETGSPDARYAVLEQGRAGWQAALVSVPYDASAMIAAAAARGAEDWVVALETGWMAP